MSKRKSVGGDIATLDRFIIQCMEPLSNSELEDKEYNKLARKVRRSAWQFAYAEYSFFNAAVDLMHWSKAVRDRFPDSSATKLSIYYFSVVSKEVDYLATYWEKVGTLIRTPAPDPAAVEWKRKWISRAYYPIPEDEIQALIANDEAFLAAHPVAPQRKAKYREPRQ